MGKNSLIKSTTKKKGAAAKKTQTKKTKPGPKAASAQKAAPKTSKAKKTAKTKKAAPPKKTATRAKKPKGSPTAPLKAAQAAGGGKPAKPVSVRELLRKQFPGYAPSELYVPPASAPAGDDTAPPYLAVTDAAELKRLKAVLLRKFDMAAIEAAARAPKPKAPEFKPVEPAKPAVPVAAQKQTAAQPPPEAAKPKQAQPIVEPAPAVATVAPPAAPKPQEAPKVTVTYEETDSMKGAEPMDRTLLYAGAAFALILVFLIGVSFSNTGNYYLKPVQNGVEIWKGSFAPIGQAKLVTLPGVAQPETIKEVYTKSEVFPMAYRYYMEQADAMLKVPGTPNFEQIKTSLDQALAFAALPEARAGVKARLTTIELMTLLYKADAAASGGTAEDLNAAQNYLWQAAGLDLDENQAEMIKRKMEALEQKTPTYTPTAPQAEMPAKATAVEDEGKPAAH